MFLGQNSPELGYLVSILNSIFWDYAGIRVPKEQYNMLYNDGFQHSVNKYSSLGNMNLMPVGFLFIKGLVYRK